MHHYYKLKYGTNNLRKKFFHVYRVTNLVEKFIFVNEKKFNVKSCIIKKYYTSYSIIY